LARPIPSLACTCTPGRRSNRAPFRPRADADRHCCISTALAAALTHATCLPVSTHGSCSHHPVCSASSRCPDASITRVRQLRGRYRHLTLTLPTSRHVCSTRPCLTLSHCRFMGAAISPLPVIGAECRPLHSALAVLLCSLITTLLCSKRRSANHPAPLSCASEPREPAAEPLSIARNRRSTKPAAFPLSATSGHRCAPPSLQRRPPELTTAPRTPIRRSPPLLWLAIASSPPPTYVATASPPR
jgi:hypothetical protein